MRKHLKRLMKLEEQTMTLVTWELQLWLDGHPPQWDSATDDWNYHEWFKTVPTHLEDSFANWYEDIGKFIRYLNGCKRSLCHSQEHAIY